MRVFSLVRAFQKLRAFALRTFAGIATTTTTEDSGLDGRPRLRAMLAGAGDMVPRLDGDGALEAMLDGARGARAMLTGSITIQPE